MIFVTGDTHGRNDIDKLSMKNFPIQKNMTRNDYVIIDGDFGGIFYGRDYVNKLLKKSGLSKKDFSLFELTLMDKDSATLSFYETKNFTTLFVDGNHENFEDLNKYPIEYWNGGKVHKIRDSVYHLMRGQVYTIDGKKIFVMGGGTSIDKHLRVEGESWWKEEMPSMEEYNEALDNLEKHNYEVDYVLTHSAPTNILYSINPYYQSDALNNFLYSLVRKSLFEAKEKNEKNNVLKYKHWYIGHYHIDKKIDDKHTVLFNDVVELI